MILHGDCRLILQTLEPNSFHSCVTSPPYWGQRDYGIPPSEWPEVTYIPMPGLPSITVPAWTGCLGLEPTPEMFVAHIVLVFREVWGVLRDDGTLWLNFGDTFVSTAPGTMGDNIHIEGAKEATKRARKIERRRKPEGLKPKDLVGIPWRVAFALQADGWYHRMDNVWSKPNPMPESVQDRPTKAHEYVFLFSKSERYYYDKDAIMEPLAESSITILAQNGRAKTNGNMKAVFTVRGSQGVINNPLNSGRRDEEKPFYPPQLKNKRSVWTVATQPFPEAHFATFPEKLIEPCILAGCPVGGRVLDPFGGSGTTRRVALENNRECTLIEINPDYIEMQKRRTSIIQPKLNF